MMRISAIASARRARTSPDRRDSAFVMPKSVVIDFAPAWGRERRPNTPWSQTVIYEAHVKGFTARQPELAPHLRGTFGLCQSPHHRPSGEARGDGGRAHAGAGLLR